MMLPPLVMVMGIPFLLLTIMIGGFLPPAPMFILGVINTEEKTKRFHL